MPFLFILHTYVGVNWSPNVKKPLIGCNDISQRKELSESVYQRSSLSTCRQINHRTLILGSTYDVSGVIFLFSSIFNGSFRYSIRQIIKHRPYIYLISPRDAFYKFFLYNHTILVSTTAISCIERPLARNISSEFLVVKKLTSYLI